MAGWGMKLRCRRVLLPFVIACLSSLATASMAQDADRSTLEAQKDKLFQQMLANPANLDVVFAYANVSAKLLATTRPRCRRLRTNAADSTRTCHAWISSSGALYFRMGSFDIAQNYFQKASTANPPPPAEVKQRIDEYLALIAAHAEIADAPDRLNLLRRPVPDRRQHRAGRFDDQFAGRAGPAQQSVHQNGRFRHLRQRLRPLHLRSWRPKPGYDRGWRHRPRQPLHEGWPPRPRLRRGNRRPAVSVSGAARYAGLGGDGQAVRNRQRGGPRRRTSISTPTVLASREPRSSGRTSP